MSHFQMTFRGMVPSDALRAVAEEKFQRVARQFGPRSTCHIIIARPVQDQAHGAGFAVRVLLHAGPLHATAEARDESASAAVRTAFERARSQAVPARAPRRTRPSSGSQLGRGYAAREA